jgi:hypothetical protein
VLRNNKIILLGCLLTGRLGFSQDLKTDVALINKAYREIEKMSVDLQINMYEDYHTQKVYYSQSGLIIKNNKSTYQKFDNTECINTPFYSVMVDQDENEVVYAPRKTNFEVDDPKISINLDSAFLFCKSYIYKKISKDLSFYSLTMISSYPDYNQISFYFNPKTKLIEKLVFYCEEDDISIDNEQEKLSKSRIEINYREINTRPSLSPSDFTYEKYLSKSGSSFVLKEQFKNYHLTVLSF